MNSINKVIKRVFLHIKPFKHIQQTHNITLQTHSILLRHQSTAINLQQTELETETMETIETVSDTTNQELSNTNYFKNRELNNEFEWVPEMTQFWESFGFNQYNINILINLGHGKFVDPKLLNSLKIDVVKFAQHTLEECKHLRKPDLAQRYLQNVQKIFPNMILNKAIYYNPYFLTLSLFTIRKRKMDLIELISTHLSQENNPDKYIHLFFKDNNNNKEISKYNGEYLNKSEIIELIDWDKLFENVSVFLTKDFGDIIKQIHTLRKVLCVNYKNNMGLTQIEFIELFEVYPNILRIDYLSLLSKFRFFVEFGSPIVLRKQKYFFFDDIDLSMVGSEPSLLNEEIICNAYKMSIKYLISNGWIFNYSWVRLSRLKYLMYNLELRKKYSIKEVLKMNTKNFVSIADRCWKDYCYKTKKRHAENVNLDDNWRDKDIDRFMDYDEFMKSELREHINTIIAWNSNNTDETKLLLKKNKAKLREPFMDKYKKNKQQIEEEEELSNDIDGNIFTLAEKQQRKEYLMKMKKLEQLHGRLCRIVYSPNVKDVRNFLKNADDFGFNYQLKYDQLSSDNSIESDLANSTDNDDDHET